MKTGYARVSTDEQTLALQHDALQANGCDVVYDDQGVSGTAMKRPGLAAALAAAKAGSWASGKAREGIWHKCGMVVVVLVAAGADLLIGAVLTNLPGIALPFQFGGLVLPMVLVWYIITELGSIAENGVSMGAPVPRWLTKILEIGKDAVDQAGDKLAGEENDHAQQ